MDGSMNRRINLQEPAGASSGRPKNPNEANARPFALMSPSGLPPKAPNSLQVWQKPDFMSQVGGAAGASGASGTSNRSSGFFQAPNYPLYMKVDQTNDQIKPNFFSMSGQNLTLATPAGDNSAKTDVGDGVEAIRWGRKLDLSMDPKKLKRVISNRLSAQRSRVKKLQHVAEMEKQVQNLEAQVAVLSPQVAHYRNQKCYLEMEQQELNERIEACANRKILVNAEIEANRAEVTRLRDLQLTQKQQKLEEQARMAAWDPAGLSMQTANPGLNQLEAGQGTFYIDPSQADYVGDNIAEITSKLSLQQQQEKPGQIPMPNWEPGQGALPNLGLNQSGPQQVKKPSSSRPRHRRSASVIPDFGGIEQILNIKPANP